MKVSLLVLVMLLLSCGINMEKHTVYKVTKARNGMCVYKVGESGFHDSFIGRDGLYYVGDSLNKYFSVGAKNNAEVNKNLRTTSANQNAEDSTSVAPAVQPER